MVHQSLMNADGGNAATTRSTVDYVLHYARKAINGMTQDRRCSCEPDRRQAGGVLCPRPGPQRHGQRSPLGGLGGRGKPAGVRRVAVVDLVDRVDGMSDATPRWTDFLPIRWVVFIVLGSFSASFAAAFVAAFVSARLAR